MELKVYAICALIRISGRSLETLFVSHSHNNLVLYTDMCMIRMATLRCMFVAFSLSIKVIGCYARKIHFFASPGSKCCSASVFFQGHMISIGKPCLLLQPCFLCAYYVHISCGKQFSPSCS